MLFYGNTFNTFVNAAQLESDTNSKATIGTETLLTFAIFILCIICSYLFYKMNRLKKTRNLVGDDALNEINYAYEKLKNAWTNLKEENKALNTKITFLTNNITDLETANYELLKQKEKLVHNENPLVELQKQKEVELINKTTHDTPDIDARKSKIEEVIFNFINNAIKFSPPETKVFIKSYFTECNVSLEIRDNGVGIAGEDLNKAFTKGGILTAKPTGDEESTGLGLWIVKKIIEEHGGKVWVDSKLNVGTTFGFRLPIEAADI